MATRDDCPLRTLFHAQAVQRCGHRRLFDALAELVQFFLFVECPCNTLGRVAGGAVAQQRRRCWN
eukprot:2022225-Prymnesium_polylepis.1